MTAQPVATESRSPRDRYITVYGRKPVLEALENTTLAVAKVMIAENARGSVLDDIVRRAAERAVEVRYLSATRIKMLAGNGKQDQGVIADISAPRMTRLEDFLAGRGRGPTTIFLLDGVNNPSNVGMILRSATAAGIDGVVLPRAGTPHVGPLVIKASAGVAFRAPILNTPNARVAADQLRESGFTLYALSAAASASLFATRLAPRSVLVLGGETHGVTVATDAHITIPMSNEVESLNVAVTASIAAFEIARTRG